MNHKQHRRTKRKCPACKSRFPIFLANNVYIGRSQVMCFNADCSFKMSILEWNKKYLRSQFVDPGYLEFKTESDEK
jgi:hypothetical protein